MNSLISRNKRIWMAIMTLATLVALLLLAYLVLPDFLEFTASTYAVTEIAPFESAYCQGDAMQYEVTLSRDSAGPVEIIDSWCRQVDGICILTASTVRRANIARELKPQTFIATRTIPKNTYMNAGEVWEMVHTSRMLGTADSSMYIVAFTVADDCEAGAE